MSLLISSPSEVLLSLCWCGELADKFAEVRFLDFLEPATAVFCWPAPLIRRRAHKRARRLAVAEIDPLHGDDLIDDAWQFAAGFAAFQLDLKFAAIELVGNLFEDRDENHALSTRAATGSAMRSSRGRAGRRRRGYPCGRCAR